MKTIVLLLIVGLILLAVGYQFFLVSPNYNAEAQRQYDELLEILRLYGQTSKSAAVIGTVADNVDLSIQMMDRVRPPLSRILWHFQFTRALQLCQQTFASAQLVGSAAVGDDAARRCADALLPLGG